MESEAADSQSGGVAVLPEVREWLSLLRSEKDVTENSPIKPLEMESVMHYIQNTMGVINKRLDIAEERNRESKDRKIITDETQGGRTIF